MKNRTLYLAVALAIAAVSAPSQTTWSMGAPWQDLAQVIQMAAPGDIVLLNGGSFPPFALNKGLTLIGPGQIRPFVLTSESLATTIAVPPGEAAHVIAVDFVPHAVFAAVKHRVEVTGNTTFESCSFRGGAPANLIAAGTVLLRGCQVSGGASSGSSIVSGGVRVHGGVCSIVDCTLNGANSVFSSAYQLYIVPSTPALTVTAGTAFVSGSQLTGGAGLRNLVFGNPESGSPAILVVGGSSCINDSQLIGGNSPVELPGPAALFGNAATLHARTVLAGGTGSTPGPMTLGPVRHVPQLLGMQLAPGFHFGAVATLSTTVGSTQPLALFASLDPTPTTSMFAIGPIHGAIAGLQVLAFALPVVGQPFVHRIPVPSQPSFLGTAVYAQAAQLDGSLVRVSPGVGGVLH